MNNMKFFLTMNNVKYLLFAILITLTGCRNGNQLALDQLILLDANQDKNRIDLSISDIAEISYIPLQFGSENTLVGNPVGRSVFVSHDRIFLSDDSMESPKLITYNLDGEPIRTFGSYGRGPGEYMNISGFLVDTIANEVIIYDFMQRKFIVFDINGAFKRDKNLERGSKTAYSAIENINEHYMLAYKDDSKVTTDVELPAAYANLRLERNKSTVWGKLFTLYDKQTLSEVEFSDFEYEKPNRWMVYTILQNLTTVKEGLYITSARSDTTYFLDKELNLIPRFVDVTEYKDVNHEARLFPSAESKQYIFFSTALENNLENQNLRRYYAYDKKRSKMFRINTSLPEQGVTNILEAFVNNEVAFNQWTMTLNHNYAATLLSPDFLLKHLDKLPPDLKRITEQIDENDNPVLMLMKLK